MGISDRWPRTAPGRTWPPLAMTCRHDGRSASRASGRPPRRVVSRRVRPRPSTRPEPRVTGAARFEVLVPPPADGSTRARLGRLHLPHGVVETPTFMPVSYTHLTLPTILRV